MIERILPRVIHTAEEFGDGFGSALFPEEEAVVAQASTKRREEFSSVRGCARRALAELGRAPVPVLPGEGGAPIWPAGIVGTMTHCAGYRAAVVADQSRVATVGIDAEPDEPLADDVLRLIALPEEVVRFREVGAANAVSWDRLLFSAKESVYKAWYPLAHRWLDFEDVLVMPVSHTRRFEARVLVATDEEKGRRINSFSGAWIAGEGLLLTAAMLTELVV